MKRFIGIGIIWLGCSFAWMILGSTLTVRSGSTSQALTSEVRALWGPPVVQQSPTATLPGPTTPAAADTAQPSAEPAATGTAAWESSPNGETVAREAEAAAADIAAASAPQRTNTTTATLVASDIHAHLSLEHRRKGLVWFPTYTVRFEADYTFEYPEPGEAADELSVDLPLMNANAGYDGFEVTSAGRELDFEIHRGVAEVAAPLSRGAVGDEANHTTIHVAYRTRGTTSWAYRMAQGTDRVRGFNLVVTTDFDNVDFASNSIAPTSHEVTGEGWRGEWALASVISSSPVAIEMPERLNPGPLASKITFFAPISLLFFFFVVAVVATAQKKKLHPMHYFFLGCSFFAFHLLFAYMVDHFSVLPSFITAAVVSMLLTVTYARWFVGWRFALREMALSQLLYLVMFSYSFFWEGFTGLAITIGAIGTLFVMMQVTGKLDWASMDPRGGVSAGEDTTRGPAKSGPKPATF